MRRRSLCFVLPITLAAVAGPPPMAVAQFVEPDATAIHRFDGPSPGVGASYGWAVAEIADLDGDGVLDVIIGEPSAPKPGPLGTHTFPGRTEVRSGRTGALLFDIPGFDKFSLGYAVADAGDVDGDGLHDVISGGPNGNGGRAQVYSGADGSTLLTLASPVAASRFGSAVASAGDVDGDGHADLLVGAPYANAQGAAFVMSGADGSVLRTYAPGLAGSLFGSGAANAGDVDHDGHDDHAVGAPGAAKAFLYSGATGALLLEIDDPSTTGGAFGQFFVDGLRDTNADGVRDIYVGDYADHQNPGDGFPPQGKAFVFSGADGSLLHAFVGAPGAGLGPGRGAGDVDNDGCEDLAIGGYTNSAGAAGAGQITLFSGFDAGALKTYTSTEAGSNLGFDCVGLGDVDGDGSLDIIGSAASGDTVFILAGPPRPCDADTNRDGAVDVFDFGAFADAFAGAYNRFADIDHDGVITVYDFAFWLTSFAECGGP